VGTGVISLMLLGGAVVGGIGVPALAGQPVSEAGFAEVRLPVDLVAGEISLAGRRAWVWRIAESRGPETIRVLLDGDVDTVLGTNRLSARWASLWIRPVGVGGVGDASGVYEIFGYYEKVESPGGPAAFGFSAERLPIQALIAANEALRLSVDLRLEGRPGEKTEAGAFAARADEAFAGALDAIRNPDRRRGPEVEEEPRPPDWIMNRRSARTLPQRPAEEGEADRAEARPAGEPGAEESRADGRSLRFTPRDGRDRVPTPDPGGRGAGARAEAGPGARPDARPEQGPDAGAGSGPGAGPTRVITDAGRADEAAEEAADAVAGGAGVEAEGVGQVRSGPRMDRPERERIFSSDGVFFFSAGDRVTIERGAEANAVTLTGGVVLQHEGADRVIEMTARRAVVFLEPGALSETIGRLDVADVLGIYLEGGVRISDGQYTMRSPRVYYDVRADRALLIDAVFNTYDRKLDMPLYMRAAVIRQEAANQFSAEKAVYANTAFATPHLAVGTSRMTITQRENDRGETSNFVDARHITLRAGGAPFFYWPVFRGDPERVPLRSIGLEDSNRTGPVIRTAWDPFTLLGIEAPEGFSGAVNLDYYFDRGAGLGASLGWETARMSGGLLAYLIPDDNGTDVMRNGWEIERDGETRAFAILEHRWQFQPEWTLLLNGFHASDEAVLPALFRDIGENTQELTTRAHLRRLENDTAITLEAKGATTDFIPNEHLAQSPGYFVDKLPEIGITRIGDDLLEDLAPGWLTHTWSADYAHMRMRFQEIRPRSVGLVAPSQSNRAYGVDPWEPIADAARSQGLDESFVNRFDTRHELSSKVNAGPIQISPFLVGRYTAYDTDFESFSPGEGDEMRLWGAAGARFSTSINRVDNAVESRTFDLHRMRHIIEPSVTVWHAGTTIDSDDLPVYDDDVESLLDGSAVRVGLNQTWQTKRGAPGRWRSVDVFTLDAEYGWFSEEPDDPVQIARFSSTRPELSRPREFVRVAGTWQVTEVVGLTGETIWDVEDRREDMNSAGVLIQHSESLTSRLEVHRLEAQDDTYGNGLLRGTFGDKYVYVLNATYNFRVNDFQLASISVLRRFPNGLIGGTVSYNNITGETSFGMYFQPTGSRGVGLGGPPGSTSRFGG
jgi:hypothetical protein